MTFPVKYTYTLLLLCLFAFAAGCSEDDPANPAKEKSISPGFSSDNDWKRAVSRASETFPDYPVSEPLPGNIGVYGFAEETNELIFTNQKMYYRNGADIASCGFDYSEWPQDNLWPYDPPKYWENKLRDKRFLFYAYAPHISGDDSRTITNISLSYANFTGMTITGVRPFESTEHMAASTVWEDQWGRQPQFSMRHLTARLRLRFSVSKAYDEMRDIKVKEVTVNDKINGTYWTYVLDTSGSDLAVTIAAGAVYSQADPLMLVPEYDDPDEPLTLHYADGYKPFGSLYVVPQALTGIVVNVLYDVYDEQGVLTRQDQRVTNTVELSALGTLQYSYCYDLRIMISPAYLYVLSDNDVMPDGLIDIEP